MSITSTNETTKLANRQAAPDSSVPFESRGFGVNVTHLLRTGPTKRPNNDLNILIVALQNSVALALAVKENGAFNADEDTKLLMLGASLARANNLPCAENPTDFFSADSDEREDSCSEKSRVARAARLCDQCPLRIQCRALSVVTNEKFGVWGGLGEAQRRKVGRGVPSGEERGKDDVIKPREMADGLFDGSMHIDFDIRKDPAYTWAKNVLSSSDDG